jgi:hypothetical protein
MMQDTETEQLADPAAIVAALAPLVEGDGARLEFVALAQETGSVSLRLVLDGVECTDCVMARDYLEQLSLRLIHTVAPGVGRVVIDDPREHAGASADPSATR